MKKYESFVDYVADQHQRAKEMLYELKDIIHQVVPDTEESMGYGVPAYSLRKDAKLNEKIMIAGYKKHVGLYPHPDTIEAFKDQLKEYKTSKGTIQFQFTQDIPVELVKEIIYYRHKIVNQ